MPQTPETTNQKPAAVADGLFDFFVVVTPGFETLAENEINFWLPRLGGEGFSMPALVAERGGISLRLPLEIGCSLNRHLKIATRILVRLADFGCRDFPKLFKKTAGLPWGDWIEPGGTIDVQASSHKSRLFIKKRIEETCRDGFKKHLKTAGEVGASMHASGEPHQVLVRFDDDVCTISLDTSGELLHKRGIKTMSAEAPVRETIAAALLAMMTDAKSSALGATLIDPMCGSGTFFIEAAQRRHPSPRAFAFESFPIYRRRVSGAVHDDVGIGTTRVDFKKFIGFDIDPKAAEAAKANWLKAGDRRELEIHVGDIFDVKPLVIDGPRWLITNPPYGERLKIEGRLKDYYELLFETCERIAKPDRACFLLPETAKPAALRYPRRWRKPQVLRFQNGGLPVAALLFVND